VEAAAALDDAPPTVPTVAASRILRKMASAAVVVAAAVDKDTRCLARLRRYWESTVDTATAMSPAMLSCQGSLQAAWPNSHRHLSVKSTLRLDSLQAPETVTSSSADTRQ